ncbi:MAG: hypothetical protein BWZ10_01919 [candidate division BRC1 bacterium ADurb.BinA364]|nr:MAG: hypothetical protein BWZ10_01919 [candidate division BRC1 bacterium ADurb.BinA364]
MAAVTDSRLERIDCLDNMAALMDFESGATGTLALSWTMPTGGYTLEIHGTEGSIRMQSLSGENPVQLTVKGPKGMATTFPKLKQRVKSSYRCFVEAVQGKAPSPTPGELGREAIALCLAIMQSGETGRFVPVKRFD